MTITSQAPTRISLFGGGTDLPIFYNSNGGCVISMAINLRQYINLGVTTSLTAKDNPEFFTKIMDEMQYHTTFSHTNDCLIESGLGSSASCAVAMVAAIARAKGIFFGRHEIAERAWDIEVNKLGLYGGKQDQYAATFGGMNVISFNKDSVILSPIDKEKAEVVQRHLLLFHTGETRKNPKIQEQLKELSDAQVHSLMKTKELAHDAKKYLYYGDFVAFGRLFNIAWQEKKKSNSLITTKRIDDIYDMALSCGAEGGKLCGSGGGGYMVFWAVPSSHERIIEALEDMGCTYTDFSIERNGVETRII